MKKICMMIAASAGLAGCVSTAPGADRVIFASNPAVVNGCKFLGQETINAIIWVDAVTAQRDAQATLKNMAASKGATHVLTSGNVAMGGGQAIQTGDLYRC